MDLLPINKYSIEEIKYHINNNKSVVFKLQNYMIKDVEILETVSQINECGEKTNIINNDDETNGK